MGTRATTNVVDADVTGCLPWRSLAVDAQGVGGETDEVDDQVRVVARPRPAVAGGHVRWVKVIGQTVGDAGAGTQESVEQVEQFSDTRELGGVDLDRGFLGAVEPVVALTPNSGKGWKGTPTRRRLAHRTPPRPFPASLGKPKSVGQTGSPGSRQRPRLGRDRPLRDHSAATNDHRGWDFGLYRSTTQRRKIQTIVTQRLTK
jgi:hypothetical protein